MTAEARRLAGPAARGLLLAAVLLYALNLRAPITAVAPVIGQVQSDLDLTAAGAGLLTGVPVLCFALATPLAAFLLTRSGTSRVVAVSIATVLAGTVVRSVGGFPTALIGTVLIGLAITIGNVAVPMVIARDFPLRVARVTGLYTAALNGGSVLTTTLTAPLAAVVGWRWALASWGLLAVVAFVVWRRAYGWTAAPASGAGTHGHDEDAAADGGRAAAGDERARLSSVVRRPVTVFLALAFAAQAFSYYGVSAWLPTLLHDTAGLAVGTSGGAAALFQLFGMVGGVAVPLALGRRVPLAAVSAGISVAWAALPLGLLVAPGLWPLWCSLAGVAQGGNFTVIFTVVALTAGSQAAAGRMSAAIQTFGYACAALGPVVLGAAHTATDGWQAPLVVVLTLVGVMAVTTQLSARRTHGH